MVCADASVAAAIVTNIDESMFAVCDAFVGGDFIGDAQKKGVELKSEKVKTRCGRFSILSCSNVFLSRLYW
jgi:hypothetical protein